MDDDNKCGVVRAAGAPYVNVPLDSAHNIRIHLQAGYTGDMSPSTRVVLDALLGLIDGQAERIRAMEEKFDTQTGSLDERVDELEASVGGPFGLCEDVNDLREHVERKVAALDDRVDDLDLAADVLRLDVEGLATGVDHEITALDDRVCELEICT